MTQHGDVVLVDGLTADAQLGEQGILIWVIHIYRRPQCLTVGRDYPAGQ
jgi:hypothetical protein